MQYMPRTPIQSVVASNCAIQAWQEICHFRKGPQRRQKSDPSQARPVTLCIFITIAMAGFILGTGSGVLAAAAVYYTMSTHLAQDTSALQAEYVRFFKSVHLLV